MRPLLKFLFLICVPVALSACGSLPSQSFERSSHVSIKHVELLPLGTPDHAQVQIMNPIGAGFGVVGNFIESRRAVGASEEMESTLAAAHYDFRASLTNAIAAAVGKVGFKITRLAGTRPEKERSRFLKSYPSVKKVDAFLDVYVTFVGFEAPRSSAAFQPRLEISARLISAKDNKILFQDRIVYGSVEHSDDEAVLVRADDSVGFRNRAALAADPTRTARALQTAIDTAAWELAKQFM
jgi:hypothetical protein